MAAVLLVGCGAARRVPYTATTGGLTYQVSVPGSFNRLPDVPDESIPSEPGLGFGPRGGPFSGPGNGRMRVTSVADRLVSLAPAVIASAAEDAYSHYRDDSHGVIIRHPGRIGLVPAEVVDLTYDLPDLKGQSHTVLSFATVKKGAPAILVACDWTTEEDDLSTQCAEFASSFTVLPHP